MNLDIGQMSQDVMNKIQERIHGLKTLNIIVAGKTGVGKSTLINAVFRENLAETGIGKPVTDHMRRLTKKDMPLAIYDTRGFELGKEVQEEVKNEIIEEIRKGVATRDINKTIHCIWYCINTASNRVEPEEIAWLREISRENEVTQVPIIIVLTQAFSQKKAQQLRQMLLDENLDIGQIIPVLAEDYEMNDEYTAESYGLDVLINVMGETLPEELMDTLQNVQIASLKAKKRRAQAAIAAAAGAATIEGFSPVPFSDCALLIPTQVGMIASITVIFGFNINKSVITALVSATLGTGGATLLGKTIVSNAFKFIPGVGTVGGAAISGGTAGLITTALGEAYVGVMELVYNGDMSINDIGKKKGRETMARIFKQRLENEKRKVFN